MSNNQETITVEGREVVNFIPQADTKLAIVSLSVLLRLANLLPKADMYEIKQEFESKLSDVQTMTEYVELLEGELSFHKSVNMITLYNKSENITNQINQMIQPT